MMQSRKPQLRVIEGKGNKQNVKSCRTTIIFTDADLMDNFDPEDIGVGHELAERGLVINCNVSAYDNITHRQIISGEVKSGERRKSCHPIVTAEIDPDDHEATSIYLESECNCADRTDCEHAAALIFYAIGHYGYRAPIYTKLSTYEMLHQKSKATVPTKTVDPLSQWSRAFEHYQKSQHRTFSTEEEQIVYLLTLLSPSRQGKLQLSLARAKTVKRGGHGKSRELTLHTNKTQQIMADNDKPVLNALYALNERPEFERSQFTFLLKDCDALFAALIASKKAYWRSTSKYPVIQGETRTVEPRWWINENGEQQLQIYLSDSKTLASFTLLPTNPVWYYDAKTQALGKIDSNLAPEAIVWLTQLPAIAPDAVEAAQMNIQKLLPDCKHLPKLHPIKRTAKQKMLNPIVKLRLFGKDVEPDPSAMFSFMFGKSHKSRHLFDLFDTSELPATTMAFAECQFDYAGHKVNLSDPNDEVQFYQDQKLHTIVRNREFEKTCVEALGNAGLEAAALQPNLIARDRNLQFAFVINDEAEDEAVVAEQLSNLQTVAQEKGWELVLEPTFPTRIVHEVDEWYTDLEENNSGIDWFGMSLGVMIGGEKVNILPLLLKQIETQFHDLDAKAIKALPDTTSCELRMDNGEYLKVPFPRIRNILLVLCELFAEKPLDENGRLRLSKLKASLLVEIEKAVGATRLRWFGSAKLKQFGHKLANFKGIKTVKPAKDFTASLRPYQQEGLNWLQFLREYDLNGILADDMGLGKTIQTLAHLTVEKQAKRLKGPSLLIAPTSLMTNWENEAIRFAPKLNILILHGSKRQNYFADIEKADLVLTTYPLVIRDKETLLKHPYHYVILDEAHQIKNAQAKVTQIILQLQAQHRLCLTGTPMENHLGELWSLFHFILPGFLGSQKQFAHIFRGPIERQGDTFRHEQLIRRIKPFMLRRRKDEVVQDLPEKTEIIRKVELTQAQRDLYESVRLAMEKKVRKAVDANGLNRSQIIILDALLKLRQICCAPSLLKLEQAKKVKQSAKLDDLMGFLPSLIEEGRRVLLFSSFTSMLALIESRLKKQKIPHVILTGQTTNRKTPITRFQNKEVPLFLISLKAGGIGLNLTAADTVIHYDPWWNPAAEQQATDRAHRIGQKNPVFVYKMIVEGTVEERILEMQAKKREIIDSILESNKQAKLALTQKDLDNLFQPMH